LNDNCISIRDTELTRQDQCVSIN